MDIFFNSYEAPTFAICAQPHFQAPSDEGAVERSETEGEKTINIKLSLSLLPSRLRRATFLVRGRLYSHIIVNLIAADNRHISVNFHGGSKPPPYTVKLNFKVNTRLLSNLIIYATVGATCGRPPIHSKLKTGEHSSPLRSI